MRRIINLAPFALTVVLPVVVLSGCATPRPPGDPWKSGFKPPRELDTRYTHLEPLAPVHAKLDFDAAMSSREHLQSTLHWGNWPREDFTVEENITDLERHWNEFIQNEGYAFTVLAPSRDRCLGCVYMAPSKAEGYEEPSMKLAMWVTVDQLDNKLDEHLFKAVIKWINKEWPVETVIMKIHNDNERMIEIVRKARLREQPAQEHHRIFVWKR
ncbi:MAG: GNAT family N-acetyltransferase [Planctomycetota bacterium]|jgi:hypothetical protein